jgi:hypothetical protein
MRIIRSSGHGRELLFRSTLAPSLWPIFSSLPYGGGNEGGQFCARLYLDASLSFVVLIPYSSEPDST